MRTKDACSRGYIPYSKLLEVAVKNARILKRAGRGNPKPYYFKRDAQGRLSCYGLIRTDKIRYGLLF